MPIWRYIDIEDSERVLREIRAVPPGRPLDVILHTPGGLVLAAEQIAMALARHGGPVTVFVPHYAMSGGTLLALAAQSIQMDGFQGTKNSPGACSPGSGRPALTAGC